MPPKKHTKFSDEDTNGFGSVETAVNKNSAHIKKSAGSHNLNQRLNAGPSSSILGPLSLERLEGLASGDALLSETDAKFGRTSSSSPESPANDSDSTDVEAPVQINRTVNGKSHLNGKAHTNGKASNRTFELSSDSVKLPLLSGKPRQNSKRANDVYFDSDDGDLKTNTLNTPQSLKSRASALLKERQGLPIYKSRQKVIKHVFSNPITVLLGETGSGKSTQLPQLIYAHGHNERIAITQPRRVAAVNLATRVSEEMGVTLGSRVGYSVRFQNRSNPHETHLKYLTDGMLMRELMLNPKLSKYTTVILDEAHERTVLTDILMGLLKNLHAGARPDLRIIVMSATLDAAKFSEFFNNAEIIYVEGKKFPVERLYLKTSLEDVVDGMIQSVCQINLSEPSGGDILCFLPGQDEIDRCVDKIESIAEYLPRQAPLLSPLPLYASLPNNQQQKAFVRMGTVPGSSRSLRKVIFSTNIAETSVTIPGVRYVVDSGLRKIRVWKPALGLDSLLTSAISRASAQQRMGRAGREGPGGKCFRLYTEETYNDELAAQTEAEIVRCDVASTVLMLKNLGVDNVVEFPWLEPPSIQAITSALYQLYGLGALDDDGAITPIGKQMALLPISPHVAAILIKAAGTEKAPGTKQLLDRVLDIAACLSVEDLVINPRPNDRDEINANKAQQFPRGAIYGDLIMLADMFQQFEEVPAKARKRWCKSVGVNSRAMRNVVLARQQLQRYMGSIMPWLKDQEDESGAYVAPEEIIQCFLEGYRWNVAIGLPDRRYKTIGKGGQTLSIHPSSMMFGARVEAIMYLDYVFTSKSYARCVSPIDPKWVDQTEVQD